MQFKSRLIPMFQFAAFYNKDLEILPGPAMTLDGPVHTNGDLYVGTQRHASRSTARSRRPGDLYRGRKDTNMCMHGPDAVLDPANPAACPPARAAGDATPRPSSIPGTA